MKLQYKDLLLLKQKLPDYMLLKYDNLIDEPNLNCIYIFKLNLLEKKETSQANFFINLKNGLIRFNGNIKFLDLKNILNFNYNTIKIRRIQKQIMAIDYKYGIIKEKKIKVFPKYKSEYTFANDKTNIVDKGFLFRFLTNTTIDNFHNKKNSYAYKFIQYLELDKEYNINAKYELRSGLFPLYSNDILIKIDENNKLYSIRYYKNEYILENLEDVANKYESILRGEIIKKYNEKFNLKEEVYQDKILEIIEMSQLN